MFQTKATLAVVGFAFTAAASGLNVVADTYDSKNPRSIGINDLKLISEEVSNPLTKNQEIEQAHALITTRTILRRRRRTTMPNLKNRNLPMPKVVSYSN